MPKIKIKFKDINDLIEKLDVDIDTLNNYVDEVVGQDSEEEITASDIGYTSKPIVITVRYKME